MVIHRVLIASALTVGLILAPASAALAEDGKPVTLTSAQYQKLGFSIKPDTGQWKRVKITAVPGGFQVTGRAPKRIKPGTQITVSMYVPSDAKGTGDNVPMGIATTLGKDRAFTLVVKPKDKGVHGYSVGDQDEWGLDGFRFRWPAK